MSLSHIDFWVIGIYLVFVVLVGLYFTRRAGKGMESFFLGGRNLPWYMAGISMVATTFAADTPLAVTEIIAKDGISGNWIWWNFALGGLLTTFFFARLWRRAGVLTEVEFIELRYAGKPAAFLRGFRAIYLGLFMNVMIIAWVNKAMMTLLEVFFGVGPEEQLLIVGGIMVLVMIYSSLSGLLGVVYTDAIQFFIAMAGCIVLAIMVLNSEKIGGIEGLKTLVPEGSLNFLPQVNTSSGDGLEQLVLAPLAFLAYIGFIWWTSWYPGAEPGGGGYIAQRMMSTKNEKNSLFASLFFNIAHYCIRPWPWIIVGLCSVVLYPEIAASKPGNGYVLAMKDFLPDGLRGLMLIAFLSAYMSTMSTQLNWGASYLVNDFYLRFVPGGQEKTEQQKVRISRWSTVLIMVVGLAASTQVKTIEGVWKFIIECGAGLGLVLILRWYWWRINAWSEIVAGIVPILTYGIILLLRKDGAYPWLEFPGSFFLIVGITTLSWITVTYLTKPVKTEKLLEYYTKVHPGGWWEPIRRLSKENLPRTNLAVLTVCWLLAAGFTYGFLFFTGKLIFGLWDEAWVLGLITLVCLALFVWIVRRSGVFD